MLFFSIASSVLLLVATTAGWGKEQPLISNVFSQTDLRQALQDVAAQAGVNIIADPSVQGVVSVTLDNVSVDKALKLLLAGTGYRFAANPSYYLVYSPDQDSSVFADIAKTRIVTLQFTSPETAKSLLAKPLQKYVQVDDDANALAVTAPQGLIDRIVKDVAKIDRPKQEQTAFFPLTHVRAATAKGMLPNGLQHYVRVDADRNTLAITAPAGTLDQIVGQLRRLDVPVAPGSYDTPNVFPTHIVKLSNAKAETTLNLLPASLKDYVRADKETNSLAISAPAGLRRGIMGDIAQIDVPRKHIMLDARVVALEQNDLLDLGGQWTMPTISAGTSMGSGVSWPWELRIGYSPSQKFTDALALTLNLLTQNNQASIVASPQVMAQDGKEADIKVTTDEYFQITSNAGVYVTADLQKIETGTILHITPQIGPHGKITLDMDIEVSDVIARGEQNLPVVSRRTAHSTVQIDDGGTAAVAGLIDTRAQYGRSGIPGASDIPLLGHAFRVDKLTRKARQVAVFVTATVVDQNGKEFRTGRSDNLAPLAKVSAAQYRSQLEAALDKLGATN